MRWSDLSTRQNLSYCSWALSLLLLMFPTAALGVLAYGTSSTEIAIGAGVEALFLLIFLRAHPVWRPPISISVVVLYLIAFLWAWIPLRDRNDGMIALIQGALLLIAVGLLSIHDLIRTGAEPLRRANKWTRQITRRTTWPQQLADCRYIPEVAALRGVVREETGPALVLLSDPRPQVRVAVLGALEHRPNWRQGEAELVLRTGLQSPEPAVRLAAVYALAGVTGAELVAGLAGFLRDPSSEVRIAAAESLMWDAETRWPFARDFIKESFSDPNLVDDGALFAGVGRLPAAAVADLITWADEHPPLAQRAILSVIEHFHAELLGSERPELPNELAEMMLNTETPPALRVEIAALLRDHQLLTPDLLDRLTNLDQPAPIRLFAAELMLTVNPQDPDGVDVLRGLARQPNRELSVLVAAVIQNVLGIELGLPSGELPAANSKMAAEVTRRVLAWANGAPLDTLRPTPTPRPGLGSGSRPALPGSGSRSAIPSLPHTPMPRRGQPSLDPMEDSLLSPPAGYAGGSESGTQNDSLLDPPDDCIFAPLPPQRKKPS